MRYILTVLLSLFCATAVFARPVTVTLHSAEASNVNGTQPVVLGFDVASVQFAGAGGYDGTANWEVSGDGTNYVATQCMNVATLALATTASADGACPLR